MSDLIKILYVDDESGNVDYFRSVFRKEYEIITASSGDEAMQILIRDQDIPVILTDQRMPNMTGVEFLKRSIQVARDSIRILVTGYADMETVISAVNQGHIYYYISKPWTYDEMTIVIKRAIETQRLKVLNKELMVKAERVEKEKVIAELENLRNQVNPHFLFNCLNTLHALLDDNNEARLFTKNLASTYRYLLDHSENETTLESEMKFVEHYIFLQKVRFQGAVNFTYELAPADLQKMLPSASLQMMVENILKHNEVTRENPIFIEVFAIDDYLHVRNNYQPKLASQNSTGIGQANLKKRLSLLMDRKPEFLQEGNYYEVKIPLI
ncbi:MAG: LytS/YehU family sensor histidine kinase [Marinoscillum sp.]|jgi:LytS/YehU family sensor histidine kinase